MSSEHTDQLFEGILQSARGEADAIISRGERDAQVVRASSDVKISAAVEQEQKATTKRLDQIARMEESTIRNLQRRHEVSYSERLRKMVIDLVSQKMADLVKSPKYRSVLVGWIAEASVGLNLSEAEVSCSFREHLDEQMLLDAQALVKQTTGKTVHLQLSDRVLSSQGIEVSSLDGKIAYNNQVGTRLIRHERDLKELMEGQLPCRNV
jgi:vacuolar-type H+-ATPase subunit E/Vma4